MKLKGNRIPLNIVTIVLPRQGCDDLVFQFKAVSSFDEFEKMVPEPKAPTITRPGKTPELDLKDTDYLQEMDKYYTKKMAYTFLRSIEDTEGIEWEKVKLGDPETWELYTEELKESNFTEMEIVILLKGALEANSLNEDKIEAARQRFLAQATTQLRQ